jgi:hypothetical protein
LEDLCASLDIGAIHQDLPIKSAGASQRGIEDFRPVRRSHDDDPLVRIEPVHFR